jgi:hypothetical protein
MSTDEVGAFASVAGIHPVKTLKTSQPAVALIVDAPPGEVAPAAHRLALDGLEASVATSVLLGGGDLRTLHGLGDVPIPTIGHAGLFGWIRTPSVLRHEARAMHLHHHFYYLEPLHPTLGQLLLAHTAGALPVHGSVSLDARAPIPARISAGAVIVVTLAPGTSSLSVLDRLATRLQSDGLVALPFSDFAR